MGSRSTPKQEKQELTTMTIADVSRNRHLIRPLRIAASQSEEIACPALVDVRATV